MKLKFLLLSSLLILVLFSCKKKEHEPTVQQTIPQAPTDYRDNYMGTFACLRSQTYQSGGNPSTYTESQETVVIQKDPNSSRHIFANEELFFLTMDYKIAVDSDTTGSYYQNPYGSFYWNNDTLWFSITDSYYGINQHYTNNLKGYRIN